MSKDDPFPKAGSVCTNCSSRWDKKKVRAKLLAPLPVRTENYFFQIAVCPYCDGERISELSILNHNKRNEERKQREEAS